MMTMTFIACTLWLTADSFLGQKAKAKFVNKLMNLNKLFLNLRPSRLLLHLENT